MNTIYNAVTGAATAAKEAVVGKDEQQERADKTGTEPSSSSEPGKTDEPYDKGNLPTPLTSPTAAAHTDPKPVSPKIDGVEATETSKETTNADTSGPAVGNAKLVPDANAPNPTPPEVPTAAAVDVPNPAQAEAEIKKDVAEEVEKEKEAEKKKEKEKEESEAKQETAVEKNDFAAPATPQVKKASDVSSAAKDSPSGSTSSIKKRLSVRIKEKLHIGSSHKKDKPEAK